VAEKFRITRVAGGPGVECECLTLPGEKGLLLLHGYSFRYTVWVESGVAAWGAERGLAVAAPDMPYGRSTSCTRRGRGLELNLAVAEAAVKAAGMRRLVAVGASMGARYAALAAERWGEAVAGLVLVGPALGGEAGRVRDALRSAAERGVGVLIVVGGRDRRPLREQAHSIARELGAELVVVEGAGHVVHRDAPDAFLSALERFLRGIAWL